MMLNNVKIHKKQTTTVLRVLYTRDIKVTKMKHKYKKNILEFETIVLFQNNHTPYFARQYQNNIFKNKFTKTLFKTDCNQKPEKLNDNNTPLVTCINKGKSKCNRILNCEDKTFLAVPNLNINFNLSTKHSNVAIVKVSAELKPSTSLINVTTSLKVQLAAYSLKKKKLLV